MTTAYTSLLGLALPVTGELSGTWGDTVNDSITSLLDTAVAGTTNVSADSNVTLTTTTGASNQARQAILLFSGARTAIRTVTAPAQSKIYTVINATTGGFAVQLVGAGPTTGVTIANGARTVVAWNGSDFVEVSSPSSIILPGGTANGVLYLNGSKVVTSGSALTFDGTTFTSTAPTTNFSGANFAMQMGTAATYGYIGNSNSQSYLQINGSSNATPNVMIFGVASSEGMRLTSTGLGIGTTSIGERLVVSGNASVDVYKLRSNTSAPASTDAFIYRPADNTIGFGTGSAEKMRLDSSGNLGLGVTPSAWTTFKVMQFGNFGAIGGVNSTSMNMFANTFYDGAFKYINTAAATRYRMDDAHSWFTAPSGTAGNAITFTQAMSLLSDGNLVIGRTSDSFSTVGMTLRANGAISATANGNEVIDLNRLTSDGGIQRFFRSGTQVGSISVTTSATTYNTSSDYRLKNITGPITNSGAYIDSLNPVEGTWKADGSTFVGLIAHQVQEASRTQVATGVKDGAEMQSMDYSNSELIANLIAEVKSLRQRVATLEAQ